MQLNLYVRGVFLIVTFLFVVGCGGDRAAETDENGNVIVGGVLAEDRDKDGLSDDDEVNLYHTNPDNNDTDGDGLSDGEEILTYDTNATNPDTDNDGLKDGEEIRRYFTDAKNPDTDGDCLLDSFEVLNYETNASNADTDADGVEDGLEVYGNLNSSCIDTPETILDMPKNPPANDNLPRGSTLIDALDPSNDSDGDNQSNIREMSCQEGDPKDATKRCPTIEETEEGRSLVEAGFVYVPGGFDVDGDGVNEKGFWVSSWQARKKLTNNIIDSTIVNEKVGSFNQYIQKNFFMVNATMTISPIIHGYSPNTLQETLSKTLPEGYYLEFSLNLNPKEKKRLSGEMPFMSALELSLYKIYDSNHNIINQNLHMPSLKQYAQIQQLLNADKTNGGNGNIIRNGLLGVDSNIPIMLYSKVMHEFGEEYKEFLNSIMQMKEGDIIMCIGCPWVKKWMGIDKSKLYKNDNEGTLAKGAASNLDVGMGIGPKKDDYGVLVRAGEVLDLTIGITGADSDDGGKYDGIGFRAATDYLN